MYLPTSLHCLLLLLLTTTTTASPHKPLGINCRGSGQCSKLFININTDNPIADFDRLINNGTQIPDGPNPSIPRGALSTDATCKIQAGQKIACFENAPFAVGSLCLFTQENVPSGGVDTATIGTRISDLVSHGCQGCGSVPLSGDNNPNSMGVLTANYVNSKGCDGLCEGVCGDSNPYLSSSNG